MDITYGGGDSAAVLDLTTGKVVMYNQPAAESAEVTDLHERFGGQQFYRSNTGLSGAGFVPSSISLRQCGVLRTDVARPRIPWEGETLPGLRLVVPTRHLKREQEAPLIVVRGQNVFLVSEWGLGEFLKGEHEMRKRLEITLTTWAHPYRDASYMQERRLVVVVHANYHYKFGKLSLRRVLELLFWSDLYDPQATNVYESSTSPWRSGLGLLVGADGQTYHAAGGILRQRAELTPEALQSACPWVRFVGQEADDDDTDTEDLVYVIDRGGQFVLMHPAMGYGHGSGVAGMELSTEEAVTVLGSGVLTPELNANLQEYLQAARETEDERAIRLEQRASAAPAEVSAEPQTDEEPLAGWERELLEGRPGSGDSPQA